MTRAYALRNEASSSLKEMMSNPRGDPCLHPWIALANSGCARLLGWRIPDRAIYCFGSRRSHPYPAVKLVGIGVACRLGPLDWRAAEDGNLVA